MKFYLNILLKLLLVEEDRRFLKGYMFYIILS